MSIGRHTTYNLLGNVVPLVVSLITIPIYLSYIGAERFGVLALIWALLGYFSFFDLGLGRAVSQRMSKLSAAPPSERSDLLWTAVLAATGLGFVGSVVLWMLADYLLGSVVKMSPASLDEARSAIAWLLIALPVILPISVLQGALQARLKFAEINLIQVLGTTLSQLLPLAAAAAGYTNLEVLVPAALASRIPTAVLLLRVCHVAVPLVGPPLFEKSHVRPLATYGGWISLVAMLGPMLVTIDRIVIASLGGARAVAQYTVPYDLVSRTMVISGSFSSALFPRLASAGAAEAKVLAQQATSNLVAVMTPIVLVGQQLVEPFMKAWVGPGFASSSSGVAELILIGVWVNSLAVPNAALLVASNNPRQVAMIYLVQIPPYFALLWLGIVNFGIVGAAAAWSLRVMLDSTLLLRAGGVLRQTIAGSFSSFALVMVGALVSIGMDADNANRYILGVFILVLSLGIHRKNLSQFYTRLAGRSA